MFLVPPDSIPAILGDLMELLIILIILDIIISWARMFGTRISSFNPVVRFIERTVNPILDPVRRIIPPYKTGNMDFSGFIVILILQSLRSMFWRM